jgi:hypothetical protein
MLTLEITTSVLGQSSEYGTNTYQHFCQRVKKAPLLEPPKVASRPSTASLPPPEEFMKSPSASAAPGEVMVTEHALAKGGKVFQRHENLTLRVGPLPKNWEKKLDPVR